MISSLPALSVLLLLRLRLLSRWNLTRYTRAAKRSAPFRLLIPVLIVLATMSWSIGPLTLGLCLLLRGEHGRDALFPLLSWITSGSAAFVFFYATLSLVGVLTARSDLALLLLAPVNPRLIIGQKLLSVSGMFSLLFMVLGLPVLASAGGVLHAGPAYLLFAVAELLLLPIVPTSLALLLLIPVLAVVPAARARGSAAVLAGVIGAGVYLGSQLLVAGSGGAPTWVLRAPSWLAMVPLSWPGAAIASAAVGDWGLAAAYLLATTVISVPVAWIAIESASQLFATGWASYAEVSRRPRPSRAGRAAAHSRDHGKQELISPPRSAYRPLLLKEWLTLRRDPQRLVQLAFPLLIAAFSFGRFFTGGVGNLARLEFGWLFTVLEMTSVLLLSNLGLSVINREGRAMYLLALAPVTPRRILLSKWMACAAPVYILTEGALLAGTVLFDLPAASVAVGSLALFALIASVAAGYICLSLIWPRLSGDGAKQQVSVFALVIGMVAGIALSLEVAALLLLGLALAADRPELAAASYLGIVLTTGSIGGAAYLAGPPLLRRVMEPDRAR